MSRERLASALADRYRIERELGQGGMATVYLAHDLRHERDVAIKVLHPELAAALGGDRFLSEIKTTARLQHPHILPLLDSGRTGGQADGRTDDFLYYVMPFVRGETLRSRLERERQLPIEDALRIAREVGDALGAAHGLGIIHRDIKPENILLQGGHALVADFGIALAVQSAGGARMTQTGLSLGTPQYMSPEQAMGERSIDLRADLYALGVVTYEMLAGEPPFTGPTVQAIVARVMSEQPRSLAAQRRSVPLGAEQAVMRSLEKLPADRFGTAAEFVAALGAPGTAAHPVAVSRERRAVSLLGGVALLAFGLAGGWLLARQAPRRAEAGPATATRFVLEPRPGERTPNVIGKVVAISPDGSTMVYAASVEGRPQQLFRRRFDELEPAVIPGSSGATDPAFSPDGRWIAFYTGAQLVKLQLEGGTPIRIAAVPGATSRGLAWCGSGQIVFATNATVTLFAVGQDGGAVREVFRAPRNDGLRWPVCGTDPDLVLFESFSPSGDSAAVYAGSLSDGTAVRVDNMAYHPLGLLDDKLIYLTRTGDVMAAPFDAAKRVTTGPALRVASGVQMSIGTGMGLATLSSAGDLAFRDGSTASQLVYADAQGRTRAAIPDTMGFEHPRFSPDGKRIVVSVSTFNRKSIWILDRASGILSRLGEDEMATTRDRPEWSPDSKRLFYRRQSPSGNAMVTRTADRSDAETVVPGPGVAINELVMAPDGRTVLGRASAGAASSQDLWAWTLPDTTPTHFTESDEFETGGRFSPDGKWVAYNAATGGLREIFVAPFPGPAGRIQISTGGAGLPIWGPDGNTIYYPQGNQMMATTLSFGTGAAVTGTRKVFEGDFALDELHAPFDVGRDGTFLLVRSVREVRTVVIRDFRSEVRNQLAKQGAQ